VLHSNAGLYDKLADGRVIRMIVTWHACVDVECSQQELRPPPHSQSSVESSPAAHSNTDTVC